MITPKDQNYSFNIKIISDLINLCKQLENSNINEEQLDDQIKSMTIVNEEELNDDENNDVTDDFTDFKLSQTTTKQQEFKSKK